MTAVSAHTGMPVDLSSFRKGVPPGEVLRQQAGLRSYHASPEMCGLDSHMRRFAARVRDVDRLNYQRMFYPWDAASSDASAAGWCKDIAKSLFDATPFQVTAEMVRAVSAVYEKTAQASEGGTFHIDEAELPAPSGFLWLDEPMIITDKWGRAVAERAVIWNITTMNAQYIYDKPRTDGFGRPLPDPDPVPEPGLRLSTWSSIEDDRRLLEDQQARGELPVIPDEIGPGTHPVAWDYLWGEWDRLAALGPLSLSHTLITGFGPSHLWDYGKAPHPEDQEGTYRPDNMIAWIHALFMFMGTEIVSTPRAPAGRSAVRATRGSVKHDQVTVVLLRRSHSLAGPTGAHRDVDWSCRWLVQGFWRHIDRYDGETHRPVPLAGQVKHGHCAVCLSRGQDARVTWVRPHLRGPEDAPLKGGEKIYRLAR